MNTCARIATVCQGRRFSTIDQNRDHVLRLLDLALVQRPDLVCLPETFTQPAATYDHISAIAEPLDGPTVAAVAQRAKAHQSYILCPLFLERDGSYANTVVVIGRDGTLLGSYEKVQPVTTSPEYAVFENGVTPGQSLPVFDLDFGRIGIQVCFDLGFPENWAGLAAQGVRAVFWPSAYNGGYPLQTFAALHQYYVISAVRADRSRVIDPCGTILAETDSLCQVAVRDINLDFALCHYDFNYSIPDQLLARYPGRVTVRSHQDAGRFLVEPTDPSLTVAQLQAELGFETMDQYHQRHREARRSGACPQTALHGNRPMYGKW